MAWLAALAAIAGGPPAIAQPAGEAPFGPRIVIEAIEVHGNTVTAERLIRRALPVRPGDEVYAGDPRLRDARLRVLALGYFRSVELSLRRGSARGRVVLVVDVQERGTLVLNHIFLGTSEAVPYWAGVDLGDRNAAGTGVEVGGGFVWAGAADVPGGDRQLAASLRVGAAAIAGSRLGAHGAAWYADATEPYRVRGASDDADPALFAALPYTRAGVAAGALVDLTALSALTVDAGVERIDADVPAAPVRTEPDGTTRPIDLGLRDGVSYQTSLTVGFDRDTRPDPILPYGGYRITALGRIASTALGGDYDYASLLARYERWFPVGSVRHVVSVHVTGGVVVGDAPRFERFYAGDLNRLLTPRALGLVLSTRPTLDVFGTSVDDDPFGDVAAVVEVQYARRLFRRGAPIYGGDLFVTAGVFALAGRDQPDRSALPVDAIVDAGLRLDTEIGIFELTVGNGLGRVPL
ncbi:MAG: hypothetical protein D6689_14535 [Deltaproteobacteria bacterium]|nr:MAG: hypothetical protein D6689_14535 [Deltaproteobacteria bacterium]